MSQSTNTTPETQFNSMCATLERFAAKSDKWRKLADRARTAAVFMFAPDVDQKCQSYTDSMSNLETTVPPAIPFDDVIIADGEKSVLLFGAQDYEIGEMPLEGGANRGRTLFDGRTKDLGTPIQWVLRRGFAVVSRYLPDVGGELDSAGTAYRPGTALAGVTSGGYNINEPSETAVRWSMDMNWFAGVVVREALSRRENEYQYSATSDPEGKATRIFCARVLSAVHKLYYIDLPKHHLVEQRPGFVRNPKSSPKIPRAQERPQIIMVEPEAVRTICPEVAAAETRTGPTPHARRGHSRTLASPKYKAKQWQRIYVRPTWVGPDAWSKGPMAYKIVHRNRTE